MSISRVAKGIETVLKGVFEEHIFATNLSSKERPDFGLLIACIQHGKHKLFKTKQAAPVEVFDFAASGYGASYAEILIRKFWGTLTLHSAVLLGLHVVQQTQKHVCSVGGGMDVVILKSDGKSATLTSALTKPLGEKLERLDYEFEGAFFSAIYGGSWLQDANNFRNDVWKIRGELQAELDRLFLLFFNYSSVEPDVLIIGSSSPRRGKRSYTTLRIPERVAERVYRRNLTRFERNIG